MASGSPEQQLFEQQWAAYMAKLEELGIYNIIGTEGTPMTPTSAVKKAGAECGRLRPDVLFDLDQGKLRSFAESWEMSKELAALSDRKVQHMHFSQSILQVLPAQG